MRIFLILISFLLAFAGGYFYRGTQIYISVPEKVIFVRATATDGNYPVEYKSSIEPTFNTYKMRADVREASEKHETYAPESLYRVVSVNFDGSIIEERKLNFVFSNQALQRCEINSGPCPSPVEFEFQINLKYSDKIIKIMLYREDVLLAEAAIEP